VRPAMPNRGSRDATWICIKCSFAKRPSGREELEQSADFPPTARPREASRPLAAIFRGERTRAGQRAACSSERRAREGPQRGSPLGPIGLNPLSRPDVGYRDRHRRCRSIEALISDGGGTTKGWVLLRAAASSRCGKSGESRRSANLFVSYRGVAKNRISRNGNALATRRRFICANGAAEFQRLVLGFIDDLVIRRRAGRARGRAEQLIKSSAVRVPYRPCPS